MYLPKFQQNLSLPPPHHCLPLSYFKLLSGATSKSYHNCIIWIIMQPQGRSILINILPHFVTHVAGCVCSIFHYILRSDVTFWVLTCLYTAFWNTAEGFLTKLWWNDSLANSILMHITATGYISVKPIIWPLP